MAHCIKLPAVINVRCDSCRFYEPVSTRTETTVLASGEVRECMC